MPVDLALGAFYQTFSISDDLLDTKAFHIDVTGSRRFRYVEPYVGLGYDNFKMDAEYESSSNPGQKISVDFDPENDVHLTVGALAHLAFVKLHGELDVAATNGAAIGLSFGR